MAALKRLLLILLVCSPALFTAKLVRDKAVDVGCWDMWENAPLLQKWHDGTLSWSDLYAPQIQHRIVIPRLLVIALTHLSGGDFRWEQYFTFFLFVLDAWLIWRLLCATLGDSPWRWPLMFAINLVVFSPMHYQILFWGSSMWGTIPLPCLLGALLVLLHERWNAWLRLALAALLAEIATHSFTHGLLIWAVVWVFLLIHESPGLRLKTRLTTAGVWLALAAVTIACYFHNFINMAYHAYNLKPGDPALGGGVSILSGDSLPKVIGFFFAFLGNWFARTPFVDHPLLGAKTLGGWTFGLFMLLALFLTVTVQGRARWRQALPWLALAAYVILVSAMVSAGRAQIGEHRAVTPRYLNVSQHLLIAMLALVAIAGAALHTWWKERPDPDKSPETSSSFNLIGTALLSIFITAQIPVWQYGLHLTEAWHQARRQAQALVLFLPYLKPGNLNVLDKDSWNWHCLDAVNTLRGLHLLKFQPLETPELKWFNKQEKPLDKEKASVLTAEFRDDGALEITGNARFSVGQPADAVLIAGSDGKVIGLGQPNPKPILRLYGLDFEFSNIQDVPVASMYPWKAVISLESVPKVPTTLEFWALDVSGKAVARMRAKLTVDDDVRKADITVE